MSDIERLIRKEYRRADKRAFALAYLANRRAGSGDYPPSELGAMGKQCIAWRVSDMIRRETEGETIR